MVQRVQLAGWDHLVHKVYLEKGSRDKRGNLDFRGSLAPEVHLVRVCRGTRAIEGSEVKRAKRETMENLESPDPPDPREGRDRRESRDLQGTKSSK